MILKVNRQELLTGCKADTAQRDIILILENLNIPSDRVAKSTKPVEAKGNPFGVTWIRQGFDANLI